MNRRGAVIAQIAFGVAPIALAQQPAKMPRIGYLAGGSSAVESARAEALRQGLHELGYTEGKSFAFEHRFAEGKLERLPALAAELVRLKVDLIVTGGSLPTRAAKDATTTIPIVMAQDPDPVATGFITSLARPGGNITGSSTLSPALDGKRLQLLKEIMPQLARVAVFLTSTFPGVTQHIKQIDLAAAALGVKVQYLDVLDSKDLETAFQAATRARAEAVMMLVVGSVANILPKKMVELAERSRILVIYETAGYVDAGGGLSFGENSLDLDRRAATFVDRILKGAKPADLPVEQPVKFELVVNRRTTNALGLAIPPSIVLRAERVIE